MFRNFEINKPNIKIRITFIINNNSPEYTLCSDIIKKSFFDKKVFSKNLGKIISLKSNIFFEI